MSVGMTTTTSTFTDVMLSSAIPVAVAPWDAQMYSVVVGDVLFVSQELETSNGVLCMDTPWSTHPDDLFDVSIYLSLSVEQVTVVLASAARTLRYVHCKGSTASKLSPILSLLSLCSVPRVGIGLGYRSRS